MASTSSAPGAVRLEQEHRLVAEALVGVGDERRRPCGAGVGAIAGGARRRLPDQVEQRALEEPVQALAAGVDDAGLAQDREQARRPGDRLLGGVDRGRQHGLDVVVALGRDDRRVGRLADDGQDRALDRLGDRPVGGPGALATGRGPGRGR